MAVTQDYIDINKDMVPHTACIRLAGERFDLRISYNPAGDFFTIDLLKRGEILVVGEKMVYGIPLFSAYADERFPKVVLIPLDFSGAAQRAGWDELGESVFLYVVTPEDMEDIKNAS